MLATKNKLIDKIASRKSLVSLRNEIMLKGKLLGLYHQYQHQDFQSDADTNVGPNLIPSSYTLKHYSWGQWIKLKTKKFFSINKVS